MKFSIQRIFILSILFIKTSFGQDIKTKDGVSLGLRSALISGCAEKSESTMMDFNGVEVDALSYCSCVFDQLIPNINSWEFERAIREDRIDMLFQKEENLAILMQCVEPSLRFEDDYKFSAEDYGEFETSLGIKMCVNEVMTSKETQGHFSKTDAEAYCECAITELLKAGFTWKDVSQFEDENSQIFNEIFVPCLNNLTESSQVFGSSNTYRSSDIDGGEYRSVVPLINYLGIGYKLKISIGGVTNYYVFDTGASDLIINRDIERELLLNGSLRRESYLEKTEYTMANNEIVTAQLVKLDNVVIGGYTVNNVVIAIIDEGSLLCGKSLLDKFRDWNLDAKNEELILFR